MGEQCCDTYYYVPRTPCASHSTTVKAWRYCNCIDHASLLEATEGRGEATDTQATSTNTFSNLAELGEIGESQSAIVNLRSWQPVGKPWGAGGWGGYGTPL
jgi:hypothetical protein